MRNHPIRFIMIVFSLLFSLSLFAGLVIAQVIPMLSVNNSDTLIVDSNGNGLADAGDVIRYTVVIANCGGDAAQNVAFQSQIDSNTALLPNSISQSSLQTATNCGAASPTTIPNRPTAVPIDPAPNVQNSNPADGDIEVALTANISIDFDEAVNVAGDWFEIVCTVSGTFNRSSANVLVTGGPINFSLDPTVNFQMGETCTVSIFAANVTDRDTNDPHDNMRADYVFSFVTEKPATIDLTNPANAATGVLKTSDIVINFSEAVNITAASFTLECPNGTPFAGGFGVSGSGTATATINPTGNLPANTTCEITVIAANLSDFDGNQLDGNGDTVAGDDYTFSFTVEADAAPEVISVFPANGAISVPSNTIIQIDFSELVDIPSAASFSIECPAAGPMQGFTVTSPATLPSSTTTVVIDPASLLPASTTCQVTVFAGGVTDSDSDDPPNNLAADFVWSFTTAP